MSNLLVVDFKRVLKDKLFLILCILAAAFSIVLTLLMGGIYSIVDGETAEFLAVMGMSQTAKSQFFTSFSLGDNMGLVAPILLAIVLCKDFSAGTVRNKIISGSSRFSIVMSMYIVCLVVLFGVMFLHALLTLLISLIFFPFQETAMTAASFGHMLTSLGLEFLLYGLVSAIVCWLCALRKNVGLVIVCYVALVLGLSLVAGILQGVGMVLEEVGGHDTAVKVIDFFQSINIFSFMGAIGRGSGYEKKELLNYILVPLVGTGLLLGWSVLKFNKKDLK